MSAFQELHPLAQVLVATLFTWSMTALGAGLVFITKELTQRMLDGFLGFAAGVMIAASYWSLLAPAVEMSRGGSLPIWFPAATGFLMGGMFLWGADKVLPHLHVGFRKEEAEGIKTSWHRTSLLILAITLHNIPEGLAVGVAFASASAGLAETSFGTAVALA
ncbi:MAG: ZIP family metal transporter, partial [Acidobacteriota bacterium]